MEALVYGAEMVSTTKLTQFQVRLNRARQAATSWSDVDRQKAIEWLEREIHQVTPAKCKLINILFQNHERQLVQEVETKGTVPEAYWQKNMPRGKLPPKMWLMGQQTYPPTSDCNFRTPYLMLRQTPRPGAWLIRSVLLTSLGEEYMASPRMSRGGSRKNSPSAWLSLRLGGRQSAWRCSGRPLSNP